MKIWVDLANSPQVLFLRPIIHELEKRGHTVTITSRNFAQTTELANGFGMNHVPIGGHGGKKLSRIGASLADRAWQLARFGYNRKFDLAVSHNSYAQALAAFSLRIPFVTTTDYEHQPANHIAFRIARRVLVPDCFPEWALRKYGATQVKTARYKGLKEQVYLDDFVPTEDYLATVGVPTDRIVVVLRPPGSWGLYHNFENPLYDQALRRLASDPRTWIVLLPRVPSQAESAKRLCLDNLWIPPASLDGPNLLHAADLVISGGGTMNREAAVLGTPAYSIFGGRLPAADQSLIAQGRMVRIESANELSLINIEKKTQRGYARQSGLVQEIADEMICSRPHQQ